MSGDARHGRRLLIGVLAAHLAVWTWTFFRFADTSSPTAWAVQELLWVLLPSSMCLLAYRGRSWARWGLVGLFALLAVGQGVVAAVWWRLTVSTGPAWELVLTPAVLALGYAVAAVVIARSRAVRAAVATGRRQDAEPVAGDHASH